jgi:hypothetical protein
MVAGIFGTVGIIILLAIVVVVAIIAAIVRKATGTGRRT